MNVAVMGSFGKRGLAPGWTRERALAFLGGGEFDLTGVEPGDEAKLTAIALFGSIEVMVDAGTPVTMSGFSLFGSRDVTVRAESGTPIHIRGIAIFGAVDVKSM